MKSVRTKILALLLGCVLLSSVIIGGAGIVNAHRVVTRDSVQIMNLVCQNRAQTLEATLQRIEQSVSTLALYTAGSLTDPEQLKSDPAALEALTEHLMTVAINAAENTDGALTVYIRFDPAFSTPTSGLFCSRGGMGNGFRPLPPTDLSQYEESDTEHVGWFYTAKNSQNPVWMPPYYNDNIDTDIISYLIPIRIGGEFVCVVGMDISFDLFRDMVTNTTVYETGYAYLTDSSATLLYHRSIPMNTPMNELDGGSLSKVALSLQKQSSGDSLIPYEFEGRKLKSAFRSLRNGMRFVLAAPVTEIDAESNQLMLQIVLAMLAVLLLAAGLAIALTNRMVRPLRELTDAARHIADGDLSVSISHHSSDEVGVLAQSFQRTVEHLQKYISYINGLAYLDSLTGVKNKTAYLEATGQLETQMRAQKKAFGLVVFDINGLKHVNDTLGHDFGDMLIADSCKLICRAFKQSPVYRIGGDEFVVLLEGDDLENASDRLALLQTLTQEHNEEPGALLHIATAHGLALCDLSADLCYNDVFKRADSAMYRNKAAMKRKARAEAEGTAEEVDEF